MSIVEAKVVMIVMKQRRVRGRTARKAEISDGNQTIGGG